MRKYVQQKNSVGNYIFNIDETYSRIKLAARIIASIPNPSEVIVVCAKEYGQRAVYKFGQYTGCTASASSRWIPGTLTNQLTKKFQEPKLLIVADPKSDAQAVVEASYVNIPTIALCNTDAPLDFIDIVIPCGNREAKSISMIFWMLAREVLVLQGKHQKGKEWKEMVDLFIARDIETIRSQQEQIKREEEEENEKKNEEAVNKDAPKQGEEQEENW